MSRARERADGSFGDLDITDVGSIQLDSISGDGDTNTSITFSGSDVITVATGGATSFTANADQTISFSEDVKFPDSKKAIFGAGSDLQIYHDGSHSYIQDTATGHLRLAGDDLQIVNAAIDKNYIICANNGAVDIYHAGTKKFETTATGITVHDSSNPKITVRSNDGTSASVKLQRINENDTSTDYELKNDGGAFKIKSDNASQNEFDVFKATPDETIFYTGNTERMRVDSNGQVIISGSTTAFDTTGAVNGLQTYYETDSGLATIGSYSSGGSTSLTFHTNSGGAASSEKVRIDSSGNVGIANSTMSSFSSAGTTRFVVGDGSGDEGMTIYSGNASAANIAFADGTSGDARHAGIISYKHDENSMRFFTNASERMKILNDGKVGIGTSSPAGALEIFSGSQPQLKVGTASATAERNAAFFVYATNSATAGSRKVELVLDADGGDASGTDYLVIKKTGGDGDADITNQNNANLSFGTNNTERMRLTADGKLGIGTTSPTGNLEIKGTGLQHFRIQTDSSNNVPKVELRNTNTGFQLSMPANTAAGTFNIADSEKMRIDSSGATVTGDVTASGGSFLLNSTNFLQFSNNSFARLVVNDTEVLRVTSAGLGTFNDGVVASGDSRFNVTNNNNQAFQVGSSDDNKECVRIQHSDADNPQGLVIAYTGGAPDSAGGDKFIRCSDTGAERFHVDSAGDILADGVATNSDERLKENIVDATAKWDDIKALKVRNFTWKAEHHPKRNHKHIGFIAQEFETVFPSLVKEHNIHPDPVYVEADKDEDGNLPEGKEIGDAKNTKNRKNIHTTAMIPMLTKALQEAMERIEILEQEVKELKG